MNKQNVELVNAIRDLYRLELEWCSNPQNDKIINE